MRWRYCRRVVGHNHRLLGDKYFNMGKRPHRWYCRPSRSGSELHCRMYVYGQHLCKERLRGWYCRLFEHEKARRHSSGYLQLCKLRLNKYRRLETRRYSRRDDCDRHVDSKLLLRNVAQRAERERRARRNAECIGGQLRICRNV